MVNDLLKVLSGVAVGTLVTTIIFLVLMPQSLDFQTLNSNLDATNQLLKKDVTILTNINSNLSVIESSLNTFDENVDLLAETKDELIETKNEVVNFEPSTTIQVNEEQLTQAISSVVNSRYNVLVISLTLKISLVFSFALNLYLAYKIIRLKN